MRAEELKTAAGLKTADARIAPVRIYGHRMWTEILTEWWVQEGQQRDWMLEAGKVL